MREKSTKITVDITVDEDAFPILIEEEGSIKRGQHLTGLCPNCGAKTYDIFSKGENIPWIEHYGAINLTVNSS